MGIRIRLRTDANWNDLETRLWLDEGKPCSWLSPEARDRILRLETAKPGDIWPIYWAAKDGHGPLAGYAICCPRCNQIHCWTTAANCGSRRATEHGGFTCEHSGKGSCWEWTGSVEDGTLTANPSLHCQPPYGCGWHGWLRNGELIEV